MSHFRDSRGAMDIDGLGEQQIATFIDLGLLTDPADIYRLDFEAIPREELSRLQGRLDREPAQRHRSLGTHRPLADLAVRV